MGTALATHETLRGLESARISEPGHLEGGDVLKIGRTAYVGRSSRTDHEGIRQLRAPIEPRGWRVHVVPVTRVLQLKSGVTALPDGTVIGYERRSTTRRSSRGSWPFRKEHGTAVVVLDNETLLMSADAPRTSKMLASGGLEVVTVAIHRVREARGLRDLSVGPSSTLISCGFAFEHVF